MEPRLLLGGELFGRCDPDHAAHPHEAETLGQQDDVQGLVPGNVHQTNRDLAAYLVARDDVEVRDLRDQAEHVVDLHVLEVQGDAAAGVLLAVDETPFSQDRHRACRRIDRRRHLGDHLVLDLGQGLGGRAARCRFALCRSSGAEIPEHGQLRSNLAPVREVEEEHGSLLLDPGLEPRRVADHHPHLRLRGPGLCEGGHQRDRSRLLRSDPDRCLGIDGRPVDHYDDGVGIWLRQVIVDRCVAQDHHPVSALLCIELDAIDLERRSLLGIRLGRVRFAGVLAHRLDRGGLHGRL